MGKADYEKLSQHDEHDEGKEKKKKPKDAAKWPFFSTRKVQRTTLQAAVVACFRLQYSRNMLIQNRLGFCVQISIQLLTQLVVGFIAFIFNSVTANTMITTFSETAVSRMIQTIRTALHQSSDPLAFQPVPLTVGAACATQNCHPWIGYLMMFLWFGMMMKNILDDLFLIQLICWFPMTAPKDPSKKGEKGGGGEKKAKDDPNKSYKMMGKKSEKINYMQTKWKLFALVFLMVPHVLCQFFITYSGVKFLAMTGDAGRLILKAMTLRFVLSFDRLFYAAFHSDLFNTYIKKCKYQWVRPQERNYWGSWLASLFKVLVCILFTGLAWSNYKHMLKLRHYCGLYQASLPRDCLGGTCGPSLMNLFRFGIGR